jgi:ubiquinone/menaquinone biosynthesis C-methylase UbiE
VKEDPLGENTDIRSYKDYKKIIKQQSAKSMHTLYDAMYFQKHVGNKEMGRVYLETKGMAQTPYTVLPLKVANIQPGDRVIDIGCGRGEVVFQAAKAGAKAVGIDYAESAIHLAQSVRLQNDASIQALTEFTCTNAEKLEFPDNSFNKAFFLDVIEHVATDELLRILKEIHRILEPGGILIIHSTPNVLSRTYGYRLQAFFYFLKHWSLPVHPVVQQYRTLKTDPDYDERKVFLHINEHSIFSLRRALKECGFISQVSLLRSGSPWESDKSIFSIILHRIFKMLRVHYLLGSDLFAVASPKKE